jgi:hypothetical protein
MFETLLSQLLARLLGTQIDFSLSLSLFALVRKQSRDVCRLLKSTGDYVENLNVQNLRVAIWQGTCVVSLCSARARMRVSVCV